MDIVFSKLIKWVVQRIFKRLMYIWQFSYLFIFRLVQVRIYGRTHLEISCKKRVLKNFVKFTENDFDEIFTNLSKMLFSCDFFNAYFTEHLLMTASEFTLWIWVITKRFHGFVLFCLGSSLKAFLEVGRAE